MKEYNRETRKYEEKTTEQVPDLKTRELCHRKMPHNYVLALPDYLECKNPDATEEGILEYYASEDRELEFKRNEDRILKAVGIFKGFRDAKCSRYYVCSECGKRKIDY